jgi:hypothetical protein
MLSRDGHQSVVGKGTTIVPALNTIFASEHPVGPRAGDEL